MVSWGRRTGRREAWALRKGGGKLWGTGSGGQGIRPNRGDMGSGEGSEPIWECRGSEEMVGLVSLGVGALG